MSLQYEPASEPLHISVKQLCVAGYGVAMVDVPATHGVATYGVTRVIYHQRY